MGQMTQPTVLKHWRACQTWKLFNNHWTTPPPPPPRLLHPVNGLFSRTTWVSWQQKGKPFWILLEQEMMGWQWHELDHMQIICMVAPRSRQITTPVPHHSLFTNRMPFLLANQQCQSNEGKSTEGNKAYINTTEYMNRVTVNSYLFNITLCFSQALYNTVTKGCWIILFFFICTKKHITTELRLSLK